MSAEIDERVREVAEMVIPIVKRRLLVAMERSSEEKSELRGEGRNESNR